MAAHRMFQKAQALEKEVKELYLKMTAGAHIAAEATIETAEPIILTSVATGAARNETTFELVVEAAAANTDDEIEVAFTGTAGAIVCTITPNDGTNNSDTPVDLTAEELVELINTGDVVAKNIVLTDGSSLRELQTAEGGDDTALSSDDDAEVEFAGGGAADPTIVSGAGVRSVARSGVGEYTITLDQNFPKMMYAKAIIMSSSGVDLRAQLSNDSITSGSLKLMLTAGADATEPAEDLAILVAIEPKNSSV